LVRVAERDNVTSLHHLLCITWKQPNYTWTQEENMSLDFLHLNLNHHLKAMFLVNWCCCLTLSLDIFTWICFVLPGRKDKTVIDFQSGFKRFLQHLCSKCSTKGLVGDRVCSGSIMAVIWM
jgi:hypothetical protein